MTALAARAGAFPAIRGLLVVFGSLSGLALLVGSLPWLSGDDPAQTILRARSAERELDPAVLADIRAEAGIPADPVSGTLSWLAGALRGDFGNSWITGAPVSPSVVQALGISMTLAGCAAAVSLVVGLLVLAPSVWRATGTGEPVGNGAAATGAALAALPEFLIAALLLVVVSVHWGLAPTSGWTGPANIPLPALALGLPAAGVLSRVLASAVDSTLAETWVRTWRATGFRRAVLARALAHRAVAVAVPQLVLLFVGLLGSGIIIETIFAIPGLGATALEGVLAQDLPLVQACVLVLVLLGLALGGLGILAHRAALGSALRTSGMAPSRAATRGGPRWALAAAAVLGAFVLAGLLRDPYAIGLELRLQSPSAAHLFGTDALGRDVLARFGHGALVSIGVSVAVSLLALVLGVLVGTAGTRARAGVADVLNAVPPVLVGVVLVAVTGPSLFSAAVAVAVVTWVPLAVHARTLAAEVRASGFVQAAVIGGAGTGTILVRHLLPSVLPAVTRHALVRIPHNALALAGLGFLGLAGSQDSPEWGAMLSESLDYAEIAPWTVAAPAAGLALLGLVAGLARTRG
ncbi:ABC transporter permease subunit [Saccharopolyspora sp. HNM0983]|uniref:ABC transporter permease subunit n=1 Tax=Saccharopolyspora montiporae TaxID=2781240 RepID=A0A929FZG6_9PSEU|nr:ABC transporter permease subunit [Saccharopolyspora sp. HNM0983]MBE9373717.1 ABC transporter permease subunit [Saccharopolyspora sp. HNM0983]